ncbi:MAG: multicopper oxidase domain-containing protein, partial [Thermodesulfovibrionales bacterium]
LDPTTIPKYETPLVIPPVMKNSGPVNQYDIAVREFRQQILPGGIWNDIGLTASTFPATTVWSYGPAADPVPDVAPAANSQFNYPAYTVETVSNRPVKVRWRNELVAIDSNTGFPYPEGSPSRLYLSHLLPVDQTLHWANPPMDCIMGPARTDCMGSDPNPYAGPVPLITHVHGSHVEGHSDGFPEAWWLPAASDIPSGYATHGGLFDDASGSNPGNLGYADFVYRNNQPATTLWYHDHSLGMTRSNVYAGPAGFWLVRGGTFDGARRKDSIPTARGGKRAVLPGPAPVAGQSVIDLNTATGVRKSIREIPIAIQDRSFNADGSLFYPANRAFFEGLGDGQTPSTPGNIAAGLVIPFIPDPASDIAPIWNPEAFFNTMVVNGTAWPQFDVSPALYRIRFLNGCNSRFLWLKFSNPNVKVWQIGAEQGFLPAPVLMNNLNLDQSGDGTAQLLMALAERADVIVDFRGLADGTEIELLNIGPDEPFGGGIPETDFPAADPATTGKVMKFKVNSGLLVARDSLTTPPDQLVLRAEPALAAPTGPSRDVSLNEEGSSLICATEGDNEAIVAVPDSTPPACSNGGEPFGPKAALLGLVQNPGPGATGVALKWNDESGVSQPVDFKMANGSVRQALVTENPTVGDIEEWNIYNFTEDAHPIHLHLVRFQVVSRGAIADYPITPGTGVEPWETGYKDTVVSYPGEITTVRAKFDIAGLYVWHCHIVEHEDNEMMRPYVVSPLP